MSKIGKLHELGIRILAGGARLVFVLFGGLRVRGLENIPADGPVIIASNHTSLTDPVGILAVSPRLLHYMAAAELHEIPLLGRLIEFLQAFPVRRGQNDLQAIAKCRQLLREGQGVVMYPEGQLTRDGYLGEFHDGAVLMALRSKCPVVPVVMIGFDRMLPLGGKFLRFAYKEIRFGKPLSFDDLDDMKSVKQRAVYASARLRQAMVALGAKEKPIPEEPR
ncbi:1-acyl-sn-glycerol-3-phosphate acyltransferase [bacterium]|nr:1-acyl-sn-glycerol-3-phosphate acyltransferase [bacterium]